MSLQKYFAPILKMEATLRRTPFCRLCEGVHRQLFVFTQPWAKAYLRCRHQMQHRCIIFASKGHKAELQRIKLRRILLLVTDQLNVMLPKFLECHAGVQCAKEGAVTACASRVVLAHVMHNENCCTKLMHEIVTALDKLTHVLWCILIAATE